MPYLDDLLNTQNLTKAELDALRGFRDQIENVLKAMNGNPRVYYAGSYGKHTMIRERYDLDLVVYWPHTTNFTLQQIYDGVGQQLANHRWYANRKTVCWEIPFYNTTFHIDVVPGRALDTNFYEANLYRTDTRTSLKTSVKHHIDSVRSSGRLDAIRLMKVWKEKKKVAFKKSFLLELMTIEGCKGKPTTDIDAQLMASFAYIRDNILSCNFKDPANSNNSLSDDLDSAARSQIHKAAQDALSAKYWSDVFS